jgi:manganese/zinc/iron transport system substrate-binding protein
MLAALWGVGVATGATQAAEPIRIACTIGMITDAAREVGGERVSVTGIMGEGVDPHQYKASPGDVRLLSDSDLILYCGLNLEGRMADALVKLARKKSVVAISEGVDEALLREPPEFAGHYDPHIWFDVLLWMKAVERTRDAIIERDPAGADAYRASAEGYLRELGELHEWCKARIATIPESSRVLVTAHDAFGYFGRAYGLEVMAIQGISTDSEASLKDVNALVDTIVSRRIPAVFVESSVPRKTIDALIEGCRARGHEVRIGGELFSDAMGREGTPEGTYIGMVRHNVTCIVSALGGDAAGATLPTEQERE